MSLTKQEVDVAIEAAEKWPAGVGRYALAIIDGEVEEDSPDPIRDGLLSGDASIVL